MERNITAPTRRVAVALVLVTALLTTVVTPALAWGDDDWGGDDDSGYGSDLGEECDESEIPGPTEACPESHGEISLGTDRAPAMTAGDHSEDDLSVCQPLGEEMVEWHQATSAIGVATKWHAVAAYGDCVRQNQDADQRDGWYYND